MDVTYRAASLGSTRRRPKTFAADRSCREDGCDTRLSRYNGGDHCHVHAPIRFRRLRGEFSPEWRARQS